MLLRYEWAGSPCSALSLRAYRRRVGCLATLCHGKESRRSQVARESNQPRRRFARSLSMTGFPDALGTTRRVQALPYESGTRPTDPKKGVGLGPKREGFQMGFGVPKPSETLSSVGPPDPPKRAKKGPFLTPAAQSSGGVGGLRPLT